MFSFSYHHCTESEGRRLLNRRGSWDTLIIPTLGSPGERDKRWERPGIHTINTSFFGDHMRLFLTITELKAMVNVLKNKTKVYNVCSPMRLSSLNLTLRVLLIPQKAQVFSLNLFLGPQVIFAFSITSFPSVPILILPHVCPPSAFLSSFLILWQETLCPDLRHPLPYATWFQSDCLWLRLKKVCLTLFVDLH